MYSASTSNQSAPPARRLWRKGFFGRSILVGLSICLLLIVGLALWGFAIQPWYQSRTQTRREFAAIDQAVSGIRPVFASHDVAYEQRSGKRTPGTETADIPRYDLVVVVNEGDGQTLLTRVKQRLAELGFEQDAATLQWRHSYGDTLIAVGLAVLPGGQQYGDNGNTIPAHHDGLSLIAYSPSD